MKKFALIGAAGYIAPKHMQAIKETGNNLVTAMDPFDSVGIMDSYFPNADFFVEFERFDRHIEKLRRNKEGVDYVSICSPNYLHDSHIRFGLRQNADVICEKPIVLNPWNLENLIQIEKETGKKINNILQLRLHESIRDLKNFISLHPKDKIFDVDLTYLTARGNWYYTSWKGDTSKSGGISTTIGIHFFDILIEIFGSVISNQVHIHTHDRAAGYLELERARVRWFLSINANHLPIELKKSGVSTFRKLVVDTQIFDLSNGFNNLHTKSYQKILANKGFGIQEVKKVIDLIYEVRNKKARGLKGDYHPMAKFPLSKHPFKR